MKSILLISGDPNSVNSEIIAKSIKKIDKKILKRIYLITNYNLIKKQFNILNYNLNLVKVKNLDDKINEEGLKIIDIKINYSNPFKVSKNESSKFILKSLNLGHYLALKNTVSGIINCPIDKKLLNKKEFGVTEYLANKCKVNNDTETMLIKNENLAVCPVTTHWDLAKVPKLINKNLIVKKVKIIHKWYNSILKKNPKIAILGLNPHNSELKKNSEEIREIIPAIRKLKKLNINCYGPIPSDTIFINDYKNFDVIVGMYHDQVLSPFKAIFKFNAINLTLGLKYLRVSPDHGTAKKLVKKNKASHESLLNCINFIKNF